MAFSKQRELIRTQNIINKQRRKQIKRLEQNPEQIPDTEDDPTVSDFVDTNFRDFSGSGGGLGGFQQDFQGFQKGFQQGYPEESHAFNSDDDYDEHEPVSAYEPAYASVSVLGSGSSRLPTIFVSIPSYRDIECQKTVADCFEKANHPERIFVGVFQQNDPIEDKTFDCMNSATAKKHQENIRVLRVSADQAAGPVFARATIEKNLFRDEDYVLCIDAHTLFSPHWDDEIIRQLNMCQSTKPVLTAYPEEFDRRTRVLPPASLTPSFLKFRDFHPKLGFPQFDRVRFASFPSRPLPSLYWAAGFSFARSEIVHEVPFDPNLKYMFLGEEISMAARLYTHGWDTFSPISNIVFHYTPRQYRPVFWEQFYKKDGVCKVSHEIRVQRKSLEAQSVDRVRALLSGGTIESPYSCGCIRSLAEFETFIGLDLQNRRHKRHAKWGLTKNADSEEKRIKFGNALA